MYARWKNRSGGWTKLFIMIKAFEVSCPILKDVFPEHKTLKNSLYDKINVCNTVETVYVVIIHN